MVKIVWTRQSADELKDIFDYIAKASRRYAENQVKRIKEKTQGLKTQPESVRIVPELEIEQIRELIEGAYRIVYRLIEKSRVEILTIHHSSRDFNSRDLNAK
jgi:plasmid stabilization system protein ParE